MGKPQATAPDGASSSGLKPRAMIHKKILDTAQTNPNASLTSIADDVSGASEKLVERVFEEYGDPAKKDAQERRTDGLGNDDRRTETVAQSNSVVDTPSESNPDGSEPMGPSDDEATDGQVEENYTVESGSGSNGDDSTEDTQTESSTEPIPEPSTLSGKQRETLRVIDRNPTAKQEAIAEILDVTRATVSTRVNEIEGFDWADRQEFVNRLFDEDSGSDTERRTVDDSLISSVESLESRVAALERALDERSTSAETTVIEPELLHKVIRACIEAENISEDDELEILRQIL